MHTTGVDIRIRHLLLFLVVCVACFGTGCQAHGNTAYFAYRDRDARAEVEGTLFGVPFCAELGQSSADGSAYVKYLAPDSLLGIEISVDASGNALLSRNGISQSCNARELEGLLLPVQLLFFTERTIQSVGKDNDVTRLTLPDDVLLVLSPTNIPSRLSSPDLDLRVVWWE